MDTSDDPITIVFGIVSLASSVAQSQSQKKAGKKAEDLAEQRAAIDEADAEAVERETREALLLEQEKGRHCR